MGNQEKFHTKPRKSKINIFRRNNETSFIGKSLENQKHEEVCTFFSKCGIRIRLSNISKTRKSSNQSSEKKFYKNLLEDGEFIKNEKNGKLRKVCPFSLKVSQKWFTLPGWNIQEFCKIFVLCGCLVHCVCVCCVCVLCVCVCVVCVCCVCLLCVCVVCVKSESKCVCEV